MDFSLNSSQQQLQDSLQRYLNSAYTFAERQHRLGDSQSKDASHWKAFAEMGLLGLALPSDVGGMGDTTNVGGEDGAPDEDIMLVMECMGRALVAEPYLSAVMCGRALRPFANRAQLKQLLEQMVTGEARLALAADESKPAVIATATGDGFELNGVRSNVLQLGSANGLLVGALCGNDFALFYVRTDSRGVSLEVSRTHDAQNIGSVQLTRVRAGIDAQIAVATDAREAVKAALALGRVALCAEAVGAMSSAVEQTQQYLKTRKQFGVPIASFQALQHRAADMYIATEQARSMTLLATLKLTDERRDAFVSAAKALVGQSARFVGQQAVQLHGGMGVTDEMAISHYFRRLTAIDLALGDSHHHLARASDMLLVDQQALVI
jgi:alkylation response protein AidB-like acyl-CoA dehydrogenase